MELKQQINGDNKMSVTQTRARMEQGLRQGYPFIGAVCSNAYLQRGTDDLWEESDNRARINLLGQTIDKIRFAEDIAVLADSEEECLKKWK